MKRIDFVRMILDDLANGEPHSTIGLIHWLTSDLEYPLDRVLKVASRVLKIPIPAGEKTLLEIEKFLSK